MPREPQARGGVDGGEVGRTATGRPYKSPSHIKRSPTHSKRKDPIVRVGIPSV